MSNPKLKHVVFLVCVTVAVIGLIATANAYVRPQTPTMDYVPQNLGIYDTYYSQFKESDCRWCHGASTADRHHDTWYALTGRCCTCHTDGGGGYSGTECVPLMPAERDCKQCHVEGTGIPIDNGAGTGNLGFPHHRSDLADAGTCIACHSPNLLSETNTIEPPQYVPTNITPRPYSCENCHWPSGNAPHTAATVTGSAADFLTDWNSWIGLPLPSHWPTGLAVPAPIEANGPMFSGALFAGGSNGQRPTDWLMPAKTFQPMDGTHHEVAGDVYPKCYDCHGTNPDTDPSWDPTNPYLIRMCENCHDKYTLHAIGEHTFDNTIYRIGGVIGGLVTGENKCVACHGEKLADMPEVPATMPDHVLMRPWFGPPGITITLIPFESTGGVAPYTLGSLGQDTPYNDIQAKQTLPGAGAFIHNPIASWSETIATFDLLGWTYTDGIAKVKVTQAVDTNTPATTMSSVAWGRGSTNFIVRSGNKISNSSLGAGNWGTILTIPGSGFLGGPNGYSPAVMEKIYPQEEVLGQGGNGDLVCDLGETCTAYGFSTYVTIAASNDKYMVTKLGAVTDSQIIAKINKGTLLDLKTGNPVPDGDLYIGDWQVYVVTDYIKDADLDGKYNEGLSSNLQTLTDPDNYLLDAGDELIYRDVSNAASFTVTAMPVIQNVDPNPVAGGDTATVTGANFGVSGAEIIGDGIGDDDGKCEKKEKCEIRLCKKNVVPCTNPKYPKVMSWSDTAIVVKIPLMSAPWPKYKDVEVTVKNAPNPDLKSNMYRLKIVKPGTY